LEATLPYGADGFPEWKRWAPIYEPYILWQTWQVLGAAGAGHIQEVVLPGDYRKLIEQVYCETPPLQTTAFAMQVTKAYQKYLHSQQHQEAQGRRPLTPDVISRDAITEDGGHAFGEEESGTTSQMLAKTRLGDRVTVVPVYWIEGNLCLDTGATIQISVDIAPDLETQAMLLRHAVPISDRRVIGAYRDERREKRLKWPWPKVSGLLRSLHPLPLDQQHHTEISGCDLRLDSDVGLVLTKANSSNTWLFDEEEL
jgi:CRISPR-associated endonuclease/helicase Cas3